MKSSIFALILTLAAVTANAAAGGKTGTITGVISGAHCGVNGMACPASDDLRRSELPGVFTADNTFYFLTNVPQAFLSQWPAASVTVEGTVYAQERAIDARKVSVKDGSGWRTVFDNGSIIDAMGHKEKLSSAAQIDGKWYCAKCAAMQGK